MLICMRTEKGGLACGQFCMTDLGFGGMVAALNTDVAIKYYNHAHDPETRKPISKLVFSYFQFRASIAVSESLTPAPKRPRRQCHFDSKWLQEFQGIGRSSKGDCVCDVFSFILVTLCMCI